MRSRRLHQILHLYSRSAGARAERPAVECGGRAGVGGAGGAGVCEGCAGRHRMGAPTTDLSAASSLFLFCQACGRLYFHVSSDPRRLLGIHGWGQGQDCLVAVYKGDAAPSGRSKKPAPQVVIVDARKLARNASSPSTAPTVAPRVHALKEAPHTHGSGPSAVSVLGGVPAGGGDGCKRAFVTGGVDKAVHLWTLGGGGGGWLGKPSVRFALRSQQAIKLHRSDTFAAGARRSSRCIGSTQPKC